MQSRPDDLKIGNVDYSSAIHPSEKLFVSKLLMLGESNVGKTSLIKRYSDGEFSDASTLLTVGIDISKVKRSIHGKTVCLELWDTAGQEKYRNLPAIYYKNVQGIVLVYDMTDSASFQQLETWVEKIEEQERLQKLALILIGNKSDLADRREVSREEAEKFSQRKNMKFRETSAKSGKNVDQMINQIMATVIEKDLLLEKRESKRLTKDKPSVEEESCC